MSDVRRSHEDGFGEEILAWASMLAVLPIPAALVDADGHIVDRNRWIEAEVGAPLVDLESVKEAPGLAFGIDEATRWRVRPLDEGAGILLATAEREDAGDHLLRKFFSSGDSLFVVYDQFGRVVESNAAWENLLGYGHDEVFGLDSWTLLPPSDLETRDRVERELRTQGRSEPVFEMRTKDGAYRLVQWALHFDTSVGRCFGIGRDITEENRLANELHRMAYTDELTELPNRTKLIDTLEAILGTSATPAVLFCDLDHFKVVNDSLGHHTGDLLLKAIADRIGALATAPDSFFARLGGDEFVFLLNDSSWDIATATAERILGLLGEPFSVLGHSLHANMSIGIAMAQAEGDRTAETILGEADTAAYKAKALGRNRYRKFDEGLRATVDRRFNVEAGLRAALANDQFEVHYQPIVALPGAGVVGLEALVRWRASDGTLMLPGEFLDVAEEAGLMPDIGREVIKQALTVAAEFADGGRPLPMSINASAAELGCGADYVTQVIDLAAELGLDPSLILLEVTESSVVAVESILPTLNAFRSYGVRIGLDDFGTGFSSLSHLRTLPIDVVKVDRTFVSDLLGDQVTRAVTSSLLNLCAALGLDVVLEGVETTEHASAAEQLGGTMAQGYLFHRPMPLPELRKLLGRTPDGDADSSRLRRNSPLAAERTS